MSRTGHVLYPSPLHHSQHESLCGKFLRLILFSFCVINYCFWEAQLDHGQPPVAARKSRGKVGNFSSERTLFLVACDLMAARNKYFRPLGVNFYF